jgi:glycerol-3-phosphate dehydrogenase (NAD(P)+)
LGAAGESAPNPIAVIGAGSWGTALAWLLGGKELPVRLWARDRDAVRRLAEERENSRYLPGLRLPDPVSPTADLAGAVAGVGLVVVAVPVSAVRSVLRQLSPDLTPHATLLLAAKGLEAGTGRRLSQVAEEELGAERAQRVAVLSGPNLAGEIVRRAPAASVVATSDETLGRELRETLGTAFFRVYSNPDVTGVELGGALKNPVAIAAGISDGLGLGANAKASLLTRGLAEITRLGVAAGARAGTFSGLSGLGDLLATANSPLSRNYRLGAALGQGEALAPALAALGQVAEGVPTTEAALRLAAEVGMDAGELPILSALRGVLSGGLPVAEAVAGLLARPYRDEDQRD